MSIRDQIKSMKKTTKKDKLIEFAGGIRDNLKVLAVGVAVVLAPMVANAKANNSQQNLDDTAGRKKTVVHAPTRAQSAEKLGLGGNVIERTSGTDFSLCTDIGFTLTYTSPVMATQGLRIDDNGDLVGLTKESRADFGLPYDRGRDQKIMEEYGSYENYLLKQMDKLGFDKLGKAEYSEWQKMEITPIYKMLRSAALLKQTKAKFDRKNGTKDVLLQMRVFYENGNKTSYGLTDKGIIIRNGPDSECQIFLGENRGNDFHIHATEIKNGNYKNLSVEETKQLVKSIAKDVASMAEFKDTRIGYNIQNLCPEELTKQAEANTSGYRHRHNWGKALLCNAGHTESKTLDISTRLVTRE